MAMCQTLLKLWRFIGFRATVFITVRPMLLNCMYSLSCSVLSCLSVTLADVLWPNGWMDQIIKMPLGTEVGLGSGHTVRWTQLPHRPHANGHSSHPLFGPCLLWPNGHLSQQLLRLIKKATISAMSDLKKTGILNISVRLGSICVIMQNFVAIGQTTPEICRFFDIFKLATVRHLGFVISTFGGQPTKIVFITVQKLVGLDAL